MSRLTEKLNELTLLCEKIADRKDLPVHVTDWAAGLYVKMIDENAVLDGVFKSADVLLLQTFLENESLALYLVGASNSCIVNDSIHPFLAASLQTK